MPDIVLRGKILRWGSSYGVRIRKADMEASGLRPGVEATIRIEIPHGKIDLSHFRFLGGGDPGGSLDHDAVIGAEAERRHQARTGQQQPTAR